MKAAVLKAFGAPLSIEEVADPRPGPDDAVVRVEACGIDGTDLEAPGRLWLHAGASIRDGA